MKKSRVGNAHPTLTGIIEILHELENVQVQITLNLPDHLTETNTFNESDWLREIAIALFQQELVSLSRASKIAKMHLIDFQQLIASRGICVHYDVEDLNQDILHLRNRGWL